MAKQFDVETLGFDVAFEASENGRIGLLRVQRGAIQLTLDRSGDGHGRDARTFDLHHFRFIASALARVSRAQHAM